MTAVVDSSLAPPIAYFPTKQEQADLDYEKYRHSEKILIFGGISGGSGDGQENKNNLSNRVMQLEFFQNKMMEEFRTRMSSFVSH